MSREELQKILEQTYAEGFNVKIEYINYCYNIEQMSEWNKEISKLYKEQNQFKVHVIKQMKIKNITEQQYKADPSFIPNPQISAGLCKKKVLDPSDIRDSIKQIQGKIDQFGKELESPIF